MKSFILLIFILLSIQCFGQTSGNEFETDFINLNSNNFEKSGINELIGKYRYILQKHNPFVSLMYSIKGKANDRLTLGGFGNSLIYRSKIDMLLNSDDKDKFALGCMIVVALKDNNKVGILNHAMAKSKYMNLSAALSCILLETEDLSGIMKTLIALNGKSETGYLTELFIASKSTYIERFGLDSIVSRNPFTQYLSARCLAKGEYTKEKEIALKKVALKRDSLTGWTLAVLAELNSPNMIDVVMPYLNDEDLKYPSYLALANSPSIEDALLLDSLIVSVTDNQLLLSAMSKSSKTYSQKKFLKMLRDGELPEEYASIYSDDSKLNNELIYDEICDMLIHTKSPLKTRFMYDYFAKRKDDQTTQFLLNRLLSETDTYVIYHISKPLMRRNSELIRRALPEVMKKANIEFSPLLPLIVEYKDYSYKKIVQSWLDTNLLDALTVSWCRDYINTPVN